MYKILFFFTLFLSVVHSSPIPTSEEFDSLVAGAVQDVQDILEAKDTAISVAADIGTEVLDDAANYVGSSLSAGAEATANFVASISPSDIINESEAVIVSTKENAAETVSDATESLVQGISSIKLQSSNTFEGLLNVTLDSLNTAITHTQDAINATTLVIGNLAADLSLENAKSAASNTFEATQNLITESAASLINALVQAKLQLHNAAINFDSQSSYSASVNSVGSTLDSTAESAGEIAKETGVFNAIDTFIHSVASAASKFNGNLPLPPTSASDDELSSPSSEININFEEVDEVDDEEEVDLSTSMDDDDDDDDLNSTIEITVDVNSNTNNNKNEDDTNEIIDIFSDEINEIGKTDKIIDGTALLETIEEAFSNEKEENVEEDDEDAIEFDA